MGAPGGRDVAAHRVGREVEDVAVAAGGEDDGVGDVGLDLAGHHVAHDDATGPPVHDDELEHLVPGVHLDRAGRDLALEGLVGAEQQLLAGLAARVEGARHLGAAERAVVEQAAVLAGEGHALGDALVDDARADLGQAVDVGLAGAEVAALDRVVEEAVDGVAVVLVVLRGVDPALGGDGVRAPRGVLVAEGLDLVARLAEGRARRPAGETGADDDDGELAAVGRVDQRGVELPLLPPPLDVPLGSLGVGDGVAVAIEAVHDAGVLLRLGGLRGGGLGALGDGVGHGAVRFHYLMVPRMTKIGGRMNPREMTAARTTPRVLVLRRARALPVQPSVWLALQTPCRMCIARAIIASA